MANNKKAQILAAVMCASSVLGGYTVVSAESITADYNNNKVTVSTINDGEIFTIEKGVNIGSSSDANGNKYTTIGGVKLYDKGLIIADDDIKASGYSVKTIGTNTAGITRKNEVTTIEGNKLSASGIESVGDVTSNNGTYSLNTIGEKTQGILSYGDGRTSFKGDVLSYDSSKGGFYSLNKTGAKTEGISRNGIITTVEGVDFAQGGIDAKSATITSAEIGGVELLNGHVDGVDVKQLRDATAGNVTDIADLKQKTTAMSYDDLTGTTSFTGDVTSTLTSKDGEITTTTTYSLNTVGANTADIKKIGDTTLVEKNLQVQGSLVADGGNFRVDAKSGKVSTRDDVVTLEADGITTKYSLNTIGANTAGITRDGKITTIEGNTLISENGIQTNFVNGVSITKVPEISALSNGDDDQPGDIKLDDINVSAIDRNTTAMTYSNGTTSFEGDISATGDVKSGKGYSLDTIGYNTQKIYYSPSQGTLINGTLTVTDIKNANNTFNVDNNGDLKANTVTSKGDVTSTSEDGKTTYSLNKVGEKTSAIDYSQINGESTTSIRGHLVVTDIKNANDTFNVNNNGDLKANTVTSDGDVTSKDGETTYSLNTVGEKVDGLYGTDGDITTLKQKTQAMSYNEDSKTTNFDGNINATGDVTSGNGYSLNKVGEKTSAIDYSQINGESTTSIRGHLVVTDIKNANNTFNVNNNGDLKANTVTSKGDVTSTLDGKTYSLNNIGKQTAGITRDEYGTTTVEGMTSFDAAGMSMGDVNSGSYTAITPGNATFASANNGYTQINGGVVTASEDVKLTDGTSLKGLSTNVGTVNDKIEGIERDPLTETTTIEGMTSFDKAGMSMGDVNSGSYTAITPGNATFASANNGYTQINGGVVTASEDVKLTDGTSLDNIGKQTAGITRDEYGTTTVEGMTSFDAAGMSMGDVNSGSYTAITPGNATFASANKGITQINGGTITTNTIKIGDNIIDDSFFGDIGQTNANTAGITRTEINGDWVTSIEGAIKISESGYISLNADNFGFTYSRNDGTIGVGSLGDLANRVDSLEQKTQGISYDEETGTTTIDGDLVVKDETTGGEGGATGEGGDITSDSVTTGNITADKGNIGGVTMEGGTISGDNANISNKVTVGGEGGTTIDKDGITVGKAEEGQSYTSITKDDVKVTDSQGNTTSLTDVGNRVTGLESSMNSMNNRINDVEDRIDKVGAMAAAIANLRTMGFDPEAPTEIAIGVGQYKSETGLALGVFHYPNQDFMLSASISTSGDEVMGGIGATWKLGRKSAAEKAKDEEAKRLEKAEDMKKLAQEEKVKAQAERHAKLLAEREAQETA